MKGIAGTAVLILLIVIIVIAGAAFYMLLTPTQAPKVSEIKVGIVQPLSGSLSTIEKYNLWRAQFAVEEINSRGDIKSHGRANITLVVGDSVGDPSTAARSSLHHVDKDRFKG